MFSNFNNISISFQFQQFLCELKEKDTIPDSFYFEFTSQLNTSDVVCPHCGHKAHVYDNATTYIKDAPFEIGCSNTIKCNYHRYRCTHCNETFTENIDFKYPGTRITYRLASWITSLLKVGMCAKHIQEVLGVHWDTLRKVHNNLMEYELNKRKQELIASGYKPRYLAIDEFAIHKGHTYATCVMDLELGDVIWVGHGRSLESFKKFFEQIDMEYLSDVKAVAMDMNASYNKLVEINMPYADIVYDRYHMQAQYGKEVMGVVRLEEARKHNDYAKELQALTLDITDASQIKELKKQVKAEKKAYGELKNSRWLLLTNKATLENDEDKVNKLNQILDNHSDVALCYAMKEEMTSIYAIRDIDEAKEKWEAWFNAAKASKIPALEKFARIKEKRLPGLISHAKHPISTGRLEGLNNKIKVAKRIGYGYRNDEYFFNLVKFISIPYSKSPIKT